ncbi:MAG: hypothetical protein IPL26_16205 [Leptospiraceae bacterium]|nr:hypothetical protein [Leptospiraceae bacterium]
MGQIFINLTHGIRLDLLQSAWAKNRLMILLQEGMSEMPMFRIDVNIIDHVEAG